MDERDMRLDLIRILYETRFRHKQSERKRNYAEDFISRDLGLEMGKCFLMIHPTNRQQQRQVCERRCGMRDGRETAQTVFPITLELITLASNEICVKAPLERRESCWKDFAQIPRESSSP